MSADCLTQHCREVHGWRDFPCTFDNCAYIAYSSTNLKKHLSSFHSEHRSYTFAEFRCSKPNCLAAFSAIPNLKLHEYVHDNLVAKCVFCPYKNAKMECLVIHERAHFNDR